MLSLHRQEATDPEATLVAWRTSAFPRIQDPATEKGSAGWHFYERLGRRSQLAQLNAAGDVFVHLSIFLGAWGSRF